MFGGDSSADNDGCSGSHEHPPAETIGGDDDSGVRGKHGGAPCNVSDHEEYLDRVILLGEPPPPRTMAEFVPRCHAERNHACQRGGRADEVVGFCCEADGSIRRTPPFS
jgi:hypothetical protein